MNLNLIAGGYVIVNKERQQLPLLNNPSVADMHTQLKAVEGGYGIICVEDGNKPDIGIQDLTLYAEDHRYLIMLSEIDEEEGMQTRLPINNGSKGFEAFHGEPFPASGVTQDFQAVSAIFEKFILTGNVSEAE